MPLRFSTVAVLFLTSMSSAPALASFGLDGVSTGRIWVSSLNIPTVDSPLVDDVVVLFAVGTCWEGPAQDALEPRDRDCRLAEKLGDALHSSGMFRVAAEPEPQVGLVLIPGQTRGQFQRKVIPLVKPFVVLTFFVYPLLPLPFVMDVESYDLEIRIMSRNAQELSAVRIHKEYTHLMTSYSKELTPPDEVLAEIGSSHSQITLPDVCRGPHASDAAEELFRQVAAAIAGLKNRGDLGIAPILPADAGPQPR